MEIKRFQVFYRGEPIAVVTDFGRGFMAIVEDLSEVTIQEVDGPHGSLSVSQQVEQVSGTFTGVKIDRIG